MTIPKRKVRLGIDVVGFKGEESFYMIEMGDKFDIILGVPWFLRHRPQFDWDQYSLVANSTADSESASQLQVTMRTKDSDGTLGTSDNTDADSKNRNKENVQGGTSSVPNKRVSNKPSAKLKRSIRKNTESTIGVESVRDTNNCVDEHNGVIDKDNSSIQSDTRSTIKVGNVRDIDTVGDSRTVARPSTQSSKTQQEILLATLQHSGLITRKVLLENPPSRVEEILNLPIESYESFLSDLKEGQVQQICTLTGISDEDYAYLQSTSCEKEMVLNEKTKIERFDSQGWDSLKDSPFYELLKEFEDVFPDEVPCTLPKDKGIRHEIDLVPGTKYCVTRQWPLPKEQVKAIDDFFAQRAKAGHVRESKSPHCSPTFCVKKATGGWRIVHAFNKLNAATIPAQTPIPRKDIILDSMAGSTIFTAVDLRDSFYQILMRQKDVPLTAVSTPSGMLWEWLVMPQGLSNAPATFNRCVSHLFRPCRDFAPTYFDDIFVHSKATDSESESRSTQGTLTESVRDYAC